MGTKEILMAIKKLPVSDRMLIVEKTLKNIREASIKKDMEEAADALYFGLESTIQKYRQQLTF